MEAAREEDLYPITVELYDRMVEGGLLGPDDRVELVEGRLIAVPPQDSPHSGTVGALHYAFQGALARRAMVRVQMPAPVGRYSEPEPDLAIVRWDDRYYRDRHPSVAETYAIVEVSHTTLRRDRGMKLRAYARGGVPEYWLVDVNGACIEVRRDPHDLGYASCAVHRRGDTVAFAAFPDVVFAVDELFG